MNYFIDTEFIEDGYTKPVVLLSIGIVSEDGREYYAENEEADLSTANEWVKANVIPHMDGPKKSRKEIAEDILKFCPPETYPKFWGYFADYDWVLFSQLFGKMITMPKGYPHMCYDVMQYASTAGVSRNEFPRLVGTAHNSLDDARWTKDVYNFIKNTEV